MNKKNQRELDRMMWSSNKRDRRELLAEVKAYAMEHYEQGWDVFVEAYTDDELNEAIGKATTLRGALYKLRFIAEIRNDRMTDAMIEGAV